MKKILLIEDNDDIRINTAEILKLSNYKVIVAENGKVGIEKAIEHKPDLIICDIMMPKLDGYGVLHAVHKNDGIKNTPFIFLTAKTERDDFRKGMESGADDYITKPFKGSELLNAVDSRLRKIDLLKQELAWGLEGVQQLIEATIDKNALQKLTDGSNSKKYKRKQTIYSEGNNPTWLYYVLKGKVKVYKTHQDGKELLIDLCNKGDFFGYTALLQGSVYMDTAEALEETELAVISREDFNELINKNPEVAKKFIHLLAKNIVAKENQLLGLAYNSLRKKVAEALVLLQKKYQQENEKQVVITIYRENLASMAGITMESLSRTLSDFRSEKLIDIKNKNITILNQRKLEQLLC